jgi:putative transposase
MARPEEISIERYMTVENLNRHIKSLETDVKILKRLYFIKYRYKGLSVQESAERVGTSKQIGYGWQERWNSEGYEGLKPKYAGGRPSKLTEEQKEMLKIILNKRDDWTTEEIRKLIYDDFNATYTAKRVREILKDFGMKHGKPYHHDYRRPEDSEERLKKLTGH